MSTQLSPVASSERIQSLDVLRGFAILGILIMNIQSFSMPGAAYMNPMAYGDMTGINKWVWMLSHVFADQKFMTIFSLLYGAGIMLVIEKARAKGISPMGLHYKRTFWLLVIGLIHAHLIWYGDILVAYALCAFLVYLFRNLKPSTLIIVGMVFITIHTLIYLMFGFSMNNWPPDAVEGALESWRPSTEFIQDEIKAVTGSLSEQIGHNSSSALFLETFVFFAIFLWRAGGLMLVGMALYKTGILTASKSNGFYWKGAVVSFLIGFPIILFGMNSNFENNWSMEFSMYIGSQFNYWGSLLVSFGYICLIMIFSKTEGWIAVKSRFASVGQMALTNYLSQSIICTLIFYGMGLSLFGTVERIDQVWVVLSVWLFQILISKPWMNTFRFGPFEWVWRTLTYMKRQPFKR